MVVIFIFPKKQKQFSQFLLWNYNVFDFLNFTDAFFIWNFFSFRIAAKNFHFLIDDDVDKVESYKTLNYCSLLIGFHHLSCVWTLMCAYEMDRPLIVQKTTYFHIYSKRKVSTDVQLHSITVCTIASHYIQRQPASTVYINENE